MKFADHKKSDYEKSFEDLLGKSSTTEKEREMMSQQEEMKRIMEERERKAQEIAKQKFEERKEQDFEDLASGKMN